MMGLFSQAQSHIKRPRNSTGAEEAVDDNDDASILDEQEGSIIASLISQLRVGMDLSRVAFPTFVLEPRSMLERITDFMAHADLAFGAESIENPEERFIRILQYYLAGWHIKPKGVKKPYNPVLGEFFRGRYEYSDGAKGFYVAEQISHHPPISAFFYASPEHRVAITGVLKPKSRFLGNSVSTIMDGENRVTLTGRPEDGEYILTMPNMYARGILFGKMILELGDMCSGKNEKLGMSADVEFKTKGFFSGTYNAIGGKVRHGSTEIGTIDGKWSGVMEYKDAQTGEKRVIFDVAKDGLKVIPIVCAPEEEQEPYESRRLWSALTKAIVAKDMEAAQAAKSAVEERERELRKKREESGQTHVPKYFEERNGRWECKFRLPADTQEAIKALEDFIWPPRRAS